MGAWLTSPWRDLTTDDLLRERECRQWDLADVDAHADRWAFAPESREFLVASLRDLNGEISRRKELVGSRNAPVWPAQPLDRRDELERIKQLVPLERLLQAECNVQFQQRGRKLWCCCPLPGHDEQTPSFNFDPDQDVFYCFGCHRGGDVFELARHLWGESLFHVVADRLRNIAGIERPRPPAPQPSGPNVVQMNGDAAALRIRRPQRRAFARG